MKYTILLILLIFSCSLYSQSTSSLFMTKEMKKVYENGTRDISGKPGVSYWQNHAVYNINAELIPETRTIIGSEIIEYTNASPDSLKSLVFNLFQDIFKKGTARDWDIGSVDIHNGVEIKKIEIDGKEIDLKSRQIYRYATILGVNLEKPIIPKQKISIKIEWNCVLPGSRTIRMGTYGEDNFMVAYWFPRIIVYDDVFGWNSIPYVGNCEFYNDFSDFNIEITLPKEYLAWSTGVLQNPKDIFDKEILKKIEYSKETDSVIHIISKENLSSGRIFINDEKRKWHFKIENVVDFAFSASKSYFWDATSIVSGNRRVSINAVYKPDSKDFGSVAKISRNVIDYYTNSTPGIPFPFPQMTAFNGRGGMEYPGMVNDGDAKNLNGTLYLTAHEIGHSYFPFYTGLNEQRYAWMDEGLITYFPRKIVEKYTEDIGYLVFSDIVEIYNSQAGSSFEIPLMLPSINTGQSYRFHAYNKSSIAFLELEKYLGTDSFNLGLQEFARRWNGKHPTPWDFFFTFNQIAGEDLGWFWKPWFFEMSYADLAIKVSESKIITILNKGGNPVTVNLQIEMSDGTVENIKFDASVWKNQKKEIIIQLDRKDFKSLKLDTKQSPDAFPADNYWKE